MTLGVGAMCWVPALVRGRWIPKRGTVASLPGRRGTGTVQFFPASDPSIDFYSSRDLCETYEECERVCALITLEDS